LKIPEMNLRRLISDHFRIPGNTSFYLKDSAPAIYIPGKEEVIRIENCLRQILLENILPFWFPKAIDLEQGGYSLNHDIKGNYKGETNKSIVSQSRTMWFFSYLAKTEYGTSDHLEAAGHGYKFIKDYMWDKKFGGFYWEVDSTGKTITKPDKHLYGQAYALFALSVYAANTGDKGAKELAHDLFDKIDNCAHDEEFGGYREFFKHNWESVPEGTINYMNVTSNIKQLNTHIHLLEAITVYYNLTKDSRAKERLIELIYIQSNSVVRKNFGVCTDKHTHYWRPLYEPGRVFVNYGHDLENIWLVIEAFKTLGLSNYLLTDFYSTLFDNSFRYGFDKKKGGFFYGGPLNQSADKLGKLWWVQAEGLIASIYLYSLTREKIYFDCFSNTLDWITEYQVDWEFGDWYALVRKNGKPEGDKAGNKNGAWKTPYHNGRAMIKCLELIQSFQDYK
jgi:cellobiose epimerase